MPRARIEAPIAAAISVTSSGSNAAPQASGVGKVAAFHADSPVRHSSWTIAGMPSRVPVTRSRWNSHSQDARSAGSTGRVP